MAIDWQPVALIGAPLVGALTLVLNWKKLKPENAKISTEAAENSVLVMTQVQNALERERARVEAENERLRAENATLKSSLIVLQDREAEVKERGEELNMLIRAMRERHEK